MKNNKGTTLIETVMAILILSTAGVIILTGIAAVIRVMGDANTVKNQSNVLLSKAEKTDADLSEEVKETASDLNGITFSNGKGVIVKADFKITQYDMMKDGEISLKAIRTKTLSKVDPDVVNKANSFYLKVTDYAYRLSKSGRNTYGANGVFDNYSPAGDDGIPLKPLGAEDYILYPKEVLPKKEQSTPYYLKAFYPWEHVFGTNYDPYNLIIFLSRYQDYVKNDSFDITTVRKEYLHFVYNYETREWYYYEGNDYQIVYAQVYIWRGTPGISYKGDEYAISSWSKLKEHLQIESYGWKKLDMDAIFNPSNPDDIWK